MKKSRVLAVVTAFAVLLSSGTPSVYAGPDQMNKGTPLQKVGKEFSVSEEFIQTELNKGYRLEEVRTALENSKKSGKSYEVAIRETAPRPVAQKSKDDVPKKMKTSEKEIKAADERFAKAASALTVTPETTTEPLPEVEVNTLLDQSPYVVSAAAEAVSTLTGSVFVRNSDITLPGRNGLDFTLTRSYDSGSAQVQEVNYLGGNLQTKPNYDMRLFNLGIGWRWDIPSVEKIQNGGKVVHLPGGSAHLYYQVDGYPFLLTYPWKDYQFQEVKNATGGTNYTLYSTKEGRLYSFDSNTGKLIKIEDKFGNWIQFSYVTVDSKGSLLSKIENSIGNTIMIAYSDQGVTITSGDKIVRYVTGTLDLPDFPQQKVLKEVVDSGGRTVKYSYEARQAFHKMTFAGVAPVQNPYALLSSIEYPTHAVSVYKFPQAAVIRSSDSKQDEVFPVEEASSTVAYDNGEVRSYNRKKFSFDLVNNKSTVTDDLGTTVEYQYTKKVYSYSSETKKQPIFQLSTKKVIDGEISTTETYSYSTNTDMPATTSRIVAKTTDSTQSITSKTSTQYDFYGFPLRVTDAMGNVSDNKYDPTNHLLIESVVYSKGSPTQTSGAQFKRTSYTRNPTTFAVTSMVVTNEAGKKLREENYQHDTYGNITSTTVLLDSAGKTAKVSMEYPEKYQYAFPSGTSVQVTDTDGNTTTSTQQYDFDMKTGQLLKKLDGRGNATAYEYDSLDRLKKVTYADATAASLSYDDEQNQVTQTVFDETGNIVKKQSSKFNPLGWKIESGIYDDQGAYRSKGKIAYDAYGRVIEAEDALGNVAKTLYDRQNRQKTVTYADGTATQYSYDDINLTQTVTDADGYSTRETMDKLGRTVKSEMITAAGPVLLGTVTYDQVGNALTKTDAKGNITKFQYNALSELTAVTDALGKTTSYTYDMRGNMTGVTFPDNNTIQKQYNELGQLVKHTNEKGQVKKYYYDENSNLSKQIDYKGQMQTFAYDARNQLIEKASGGETVNYAYDAAGRRTNRVDSIGTTEYAYTVLDQLDTVVFPDGKTVSYGYDANGNRNRLTDPFGRDIFYKNDSRNRMESVSLGQPTETPEVSYAFTLGGRLDRETLRNGVVTQYGYDPRSRVESLVQTNAGGTALNTFGYGYDQNDNITSTTQNAQANQFTYDALNRIKTSSLNMEEYGYDDRNNRATLQSEKDLLETGAEYEYDQWNRLVSATTLDGKTVAYKYTGDGLLYERAENGTVTRFYYDGQALLAEAVVTNGEPVLKTRYVGGSDLALQEDANGTKTYYLQNAHGDIVSLLDSASNVLNRYEYDIWGQPMVADEQVNNSLLFAGEFWDHTLSLQYLRARWYDPSQGRFLNEDTFEGKYDSPFTQNLYAYVLHNPLKYQDPTGHFCQSMTDGKIDGMWAHWGDCSSSSSAWSPDQEHNLGDLRTNGYYPKARLILVLGINSSDDRMNSLGNLFNDDKYASYRAVNLFSGNLYDGIGQVFSELNGGERSDILAQVLRDEYGKFHGVPLYVIAHSGGGKLSVNAINAVYADGTANIDGLITIGGAETIKTRKTKHIQISTPFDLVGPKLYADRVLYSLNDPVKAHTIYFDPEFVDTTYDAVKDYLP